MTDEKKLKAIIYYKDFLALDEDNIKFLLENKDVEFLILIKKDEYENLETEEKKKLYGFRRTEKEPLKNPIISREMLLQNIPEVKNADVKIVEKSFKEKHRQMSRPPALRKILNRNFNTHKKGGR